MAENKKSYAQKLRHPNWQKKRLEILSRDHFTCTQCGEKEMNLQVHHKSYIYGNEPWEYPDTNFITVCELCHEQEEQDKDSFKGMVSDYLLMGHTYGSLVAFFDEYEQLLISVAERKKNG